MAQTAKKSFMREIFLPYGAVFVSSLLIVLYLLKIWQGDIRIPFYYDGDALFYSQCVKSMIDNGWFLFNGFIGMPDGSALYDFPQGENIFYLIMKPLTLISNNFGLIINVFYIITFPLTAVVSYYVLKKINVPSPLSWLGAVIYSFLPYHFNRGINHVFLSSYFLIPLAMLLVFWILSGELILPSGKSSGNEDSGKSRRRFIFGAVICFIVSASGIYYAYFTCLFLSMAGLIGAFWLKKKTPAVTAAVLVLIIAAGVLINVSPTIVYRIQHGLNKHTVARAYHDTELYSLKMTNLLLPISDHRIKFLGDIKKQYVRESSYIYRFTENESESASLGLFCSAGFIIMIAILFFLRREDLKSGPRGDDLNRLYQASILNIFAFLTATAGGLASFFAPILRYTIRSNNRLSIFIGFLAVVTMVIIMKLLHEKYLKDRLVLNLTVMRRNLKVSGSTLILYIWVIAVAVVCLFDQAGNGVVPLYREIALKFENDQRYIAEIEKMMPQRAMIFQLPFMIYPESPSVGTLSSCEHFKCYLHSKHLRWSFGAIIGRKTSNWQEQVSKMPVGEMLKEISRSGFRGVCINRLGYPDRGESLIREVQGILKSRPVVQSEGDLVFFKIGG